MAWIICFTSLSHVVNEPCFAMSSACVSENNNTASPVILRLTKDLDNTPKKRVEEDRDKQILPGAIQLIRYRQTFN